VQAITAPHFGWVGQGLATHPPSLGPRGWVGLGVGQGTRQVVAASVAQEKILTYDVFNWPLAGHVPKGSEVVRLATEHVGAAEAGVAVRVVEAARHLVPW